MNSAVDTGLLKVGVDALPFEIVLVDHTGTIVLTNETWLAVRQAAVSDSTGAEPNTTGGLGTARDGDGDGNESGDRNAGVGTDTDADTITNSNTKTDAESKTRSDTAADTGADTNTDTETDTGTNTDTGQWVGQNYLTTCRQATDQYATTIATHLKDVLAGEREQFQLEYPYYQFQRDEESEQWIRVEATSVEYDGERYAVVSHTDITARKRAERERDLQIEQLETIVNVLSHDLRNPLNIIHGYAGDLAEIGARMESSNENSGENSANIVHTAPTSQQTELIEAADAIQDSADRMSEMIGAILEFARTQTTNELCQLDLATAARAAWEQTPTANASLEIDDTGTFVADETLVRQVLENLFRNAVEHGGPTVTVRVGTTADGVYVEDDGDGMGPSVRKRLQQANTAPGTPTGLGLAIVRSIVLAHELSLSFSEGRDGGTRIKITGLEFRSESEP